MRYDNPREYIDRLYREAEAKAHGNEGLSLEQRRDMSMERAITRFDPAEVAVKGGFAVRTLSKQLLLTKDIDVLIDKPEWNTLPSIEKAQACAIYILEQLSKHGQSDGFTFEMTGATRIEMEASVPVAKMHIQAKVAERPFSTFDIDAGVNSCSYPIQSVPGHDVLAFAGVKNPTISTLSREFIVGDKISLFCKMGMDRPKDLIGAALLLEVEIDDKAAADWLHMLAGERGVQDKIASPLKSSVQDLRNINYLCKKYFLDRTAQQCFERVNQFLGRIRQRSTQNRNESENNTD